MGMSTHVVGIKPPDTRWQRMKAVYDACATANVTPPEEVMRFFGDEAPDDRGVTVSLDRPTFDAVGQEQEPVAEEWYDDMRQGYEVDIRRLPPDVKVIRFYNSY